MWGAVCVKINFWYGLLNNFYGLINNFDGVLNNVWFSKIMRGLLNNLRFDK